MSARMATVLSIESDLTERNDHCVSGTPVGKHPVLYIRLGLSGLVRLPRRDDLGQESCSIRQGRGQFRVLESVIDLLRELFEIERGDVRVRDENIGRGGKLRQAGVYNVRNKTVTDMDRLLPEDLDLGYRHHPIDRDIYDTGPTIRAWLWVGLHLPFLVRL